MRLNKVFVRFYKSFNYDYERKFAAAAKPDPWETLDGAWYPYVRIDIEPSVTTIVGANESGKSHLLSAIEILLTGKGIDRSDFCRYSRFFSVEQGQRRFPDFGGEFEVGPEDDVARLKEQFGVKLSVGDRVLLFRQNGASPTVFLGDSEKPLTIDLPQSVIDEIFPTVFRLNADIPLPASIPLHDLAPNAVPASGTRYSRRAVLKGFLAKPWKSAEELAKSAPELFGLLSGGSAKDSRQFGGEYALGRALLFDVAKIDPTTFDELAEAIADEREGYVNGVIQKINLALAAHLNFPRWWAQDREFRLMVSPREYDLVFTIHDRTGTDYSFAERSNGLKYFLSYYVQLLAHRPPTNGQQEILLMDEPDAYLSSQGQQDLLRILEEFAKPEDRSRRDQVVYVTHSPFLINRNAGDRIRVLDKGVSEEGTRVVQDAARNHYEPLRSSLGVFVGETSFIGGDNLFVEGLADQILLAGVSSHLAAAGVPRIETLDLNIVTVVPAGSASSIPYLVYLVRGRDVVRPPCVVLLDGDSAGEEAAKVLSRGGPRRKQVLDPEFIVQLSKWAQGKQDQLATPKGMKVSEIEDLISVPVAVLAARNYAERAAGVSSDLSQTLVDEDVFTAIQSDSLSLFDAVARAFEMRFGDEAHVEKVGFAKEVISVLNSSRDASEPLVGVADVESNFRLLLSELTRRLRRAGQEERERRVSKRLERVIAGFLADFPNPTTRERGKILIEDILVSVDSTDDGDSVMLAAQKLQRDFGLDENLTEPIERFDEFKERVAALRYEDRFSKQDRRPVRADERKVGGLDEPQTVKPGDPISP